MSSAPVESIAALTRDLVRIPTQAGIDPYEPLFEALGAWLRDHGVAAERVVDGSGAQVALAARVGPAGGPRDGAPAVVLNATVDTAPFGDAATWSAPPDSGDELDGWLYGRGAADSKAGVALFAHVGAALARRHAGGAGDAPAGELHLLFDAGEHTGEFSGVRAYFEGRPRPANLAGVYIGYPGHDSLVVGSRGFLRAVLVVRGRAAHSGGVTSRGQNAIVKAAHLVSALHAAAPAAGADDFPLPPALTVTGVHGGISYSVVPDRCRVQVDLRLTRTFDADRAQRLLAEVADAVDAAHPTDEPTQVETFAGWPAYHLNDDSRLVRALLAASADVLGEPLPTRVVGPSNVGNYLATLGVDATAGYGVRYRNLHGADEAVELASLAPAYAVYERAVNTLLSAG